MSGRKPTCCRCGKLKERVPETRYAFSQASPVMLSPP